MKLRFRQFLSCLSARFQSRRSGAARRFPFRESQFGQAAEILEDRCLLATLTVNTLDDGITPNSELSLREAIEYVNSIGASPILTGLEDDQVDTFMEALGVNDRIVIDSSLVGTIDLDTPGVGNRRLEIARDLTIFRDVTPNGPITISGLDLGQVFFIGTSGTTLNVTLEGLIITRGNANGTDSGFQPMGEDTVNGGGIYALDTNLTLRDVDVVLNFANESGGGIYLEGGSLTTEVIADISENEAGAGDGGGLYLNGTASLTNTQVTFNDAAGDGGGIIVVAGTAIQPNTLTLDNSDVEDNSSSSDGGGIFVDPLASVTLDNSEVQRNLAASNGGGLLVNGSVSVVNGSEVSNNTANLGGGLYVNAAGSRILDSSIEGNVAQMEGGGLFVSGDFTIRNTFIATNAAGDLGGGLLNNSGIMSLTDVRIAGNQAQVGGGVENRSTLNAERVEFISNFALSGGAVSNAGGTFTATETRIARNTANVSGGGILNVSGSVSMTGSILTENVSLMGTRGGGGILNTGAGSLSLNTTAVTRNTASLGPGGGISIDGGGILTISESLLSENSAAGNASLGGGAIASDGSLTGNIFATTISKNSTDGSGGGIAASGTVNIINSTLSQNTADGDGGGVFVNSGGQFAISNSTITGNFADSNGGGIHTGLGTTTLVSTIVAGNLFSIDRIDQDIAGTISSGSNSLIGDAASSGGLTHGVDGNIVGNSGSGTIDIGTVLNPVLRDNGGITVTHSLVPGSPAIDAGSNPDGLPNDQRGAGFVRTNDAQTDIGAFEFQASTLTVNDEVNVLTNGGFETGDFTGWVTAGVGSGVWAINDGTLDPVSPATPMPPISGSFDAVSDTSTGGMQVLQQTFNVPTSVRTATLRFTDLIQNFGGAFSPGVQDYQVVLFDSMGAVIEEVFVTDFGFVPGSTPTFREFDVSTALQTVAGESATLAFIVNHNNGPLNVSLDDVSLNFGNRYTRVQYAINVANPGDTILITGGTDGIHTEENITVDKDLTILGAAGGSPVILEAAQTPGTARGRVMEIDASAEVTIEDLTIRHGYELGDGGGILNIGTLTLIGVNLELNYSGASGGGIANVGVLDIQFGSFDENSSDADGGGIYNTGSLTLLDTDLSFNSADFGGGLFNDDGADATVESSVFSDNTARNGAGIQNLDGDVAISLTTISDNIANEFGGGVSNGGNMMISDSTVARNTANEDGGGIESFSGTLLLENSTLEENFATFFGGGILFEGTSGNLTISGSYLVRNRASDLGGAIFADGNGLTTMISNSTISENTAGTEGGGIYNSTNMTIRNTSLTSNSARFGGGIKNDGGQLNLTDSLLANNTAGGSGGLGGGLENQGDAFLTRTEFFSNSAKQGGAIVNSGILSVSQSTFSGNSANTSGGALDIADSGMVTLSDSTLKFNSSSFDGGAISSDGILTVTNTTISGNSALSSGGGIDNDGTLTVTNSTIVFNSADYGGGIAAYDSETLQNTIVAGNLAGTSGNEIVDTIESGASNLIGDPSSAGGLTHGGMDGNIVGDGMGGDLDTADVVDHTLRNNGGPTLTHRLVTGSLAVDAGNNAFASSLSSDQRGAPFLRIALGGVDIGAYEAQSVVIGTPDNLTDENDGDYSPGDLSLREAIGLANGSEGADQIDLTGLMGTITLGGTEIGISDDLKLIGPGGGQLTIDGNGESRIFNVDDGNTEIDVLVTISGLALTGGNTPESGGAIYNQENLTLSTNMLSGNSAGENGGAVQNLSGTLMVIDSGLMANSAGGNGGGIDNSGGMSMVSSSTLAQNSADGIGGGISNQNGTLMMTNGTLSGNSASAGGGIGSMGGSVTNNNSTITGNIGNENGGGILIMEDSQVTLQSTIVAGNFGTEVETTQNTMSSLELTGDAMAGNVLSFHENERTPNDIEVVPPDTRMDMPLREIIAFNNIIGDADSAGGIMHGVNGNIVGNNGVGTIDINTVIEVLIKNNGGVTSTHALVPGSPAIDKGINPGNLEFDQRGPGFPRVVGRAPDIGAFESRFTTAPENNPTLAFGTGGGTEAVVRVVNEALDEVFRLFPYAGFLGGVRVAMGDVTGDGVNDIVTAPGPGGGPHIRVFDGSTGAPLNGAIGNFMAYNPFFFGGVYVAAADIGGPRGVPDGFADIVTGADAGGGPHVRVFSGADGSLLFDFFAYDPRFLGGVRVAAGDVNNDQRADIITGAGPGGGPHVRVFDGTNPTAAAMGRDIDSFFAFPAGYTGGIFVAVNNTPGPVSQIVVSTGTAFHTGARVALIDRANNMETEFPAFDLPTSAGARVAVFDFNGDGVNDILTASGPGVSTLLQLFGGDAGDPPFDEGEPFGPTILNFFPFGQLYQEGIFVAGAN